MFCMIRFMLKNDIYNLISKIYLERNKLSDINTSLLIHHNVNFECSY